MRYVFSIEEELDEFQLNLAEYIGCAAYYINSLWLAECLIELFFYGPPLGDEKCVERFLDGLKIPSEKLEDLSRNLKSSVEKKIFKCIPTFSEHHSYSYKVTSLADVVIDDLGLSNVGVTEKSESEFLKELQENVANGDYLPERYRRLVG